MRLLFVMQCTNLGGMEQCALHSMVALKELGLECFVVSLNPLGQLKIHLDAAGIGAIGLPYRGPSGLVSLRRAHRAIAEAKPDGIVMVGHNLMGMLALGSVASAHRVLQVHFHHQGVKPAWQWRLLYALAVRRFRAITFPSDFIWREAAAIAPAIELKAHTLRDGLEVPPVPESQSRRDARLALGIPTDAFVVGNAGWLIQRKRFDIFLRTAAELVKRRPDAVFVVAGDGPLREDLKKQVIDLGLAERVMWLGWLSDLRTFYLSLDALLFCSDWDAFPTTPLEAMTYAVPVVASVLHGGLDEVITTQDAGFLIPRHDYVTLANELFHLSADPHLAHAKGLSGRARVADLPGPASRAEELLSLLGLNAESRV